MDIIGPTPRVDCIIDDSSISPGVRAVQGAWGRNRSEVLKGDQSPMGPPRGFSYGACLFLISIKELCVCIIRECIIIIM